MKKEILKASDSQIKFMQIAISAAIQSTAKKRKVGCVLTFEDDEFKEKFVSSGFNHNIIDIDSYCENEKGETLPYVVHAEEAAIFSMLRKKIYPKNLSAYITFTPCVNCIKLIAQIGIKKIYYLYEHPTDFEQNILLLEKLGIEVFKMPSEIFENDSIINDLKY